MATVSETSPIIFLLVSNGILATRAVIFNSSYIVKPSDISITRPARAALFNTASAAFLNNFYEGYATIQLAGSTGWGGTTATGTSVGFTYFKLLEDLFVEFLNDTQQAAKAGLPANTTAIYYIDTINYEAFNVFPLKFNLTRSKSSPHLFFYNIQLVALQDLVEELVFSVTDFLSSFNTGILTLPGITNVATSVTNVVSSGLSALLQRFETDPTPPITGVGVN